MKNIFSKFLILLLFVVILTAGSTTAYSYFDELNQNSNSSIPVGEWMIGISTPQEFYDFATKTDSVAEDQYYLQNDIDFSGFTWELDATNNNVVFKGLLDGDGHTISNLYIYTDSSSYNYLGVFPVIDGATIKNIVFDNVELDMATSVFTSKTYRGGIIAGEANGVVNISNITLTDCSVRANRGTGAGGVIGFVTDADTDVTISNIKATNLKLWNYTNNVGGIIGQINKNAINVSISDVDIEGDFHSFVSNSSYVGGIVGRFESGPSLTIERAMVNMTTQNTLEVASNYLKYSKKHVGGFIGFADSTSADLNIIDSFMTGSLVLNGSTKSKYVGTAIGRNLGTYTLTNTYYSNVQFKHTDGNLYYTPDADYRGVNSTVVNNSSMPSLSWWNSFFLNYNNGLWDQDNSGEPFLVR